MFNRRMFVALAACLAVSASSAFAGGNGGTKKDSTIRVENQSGVNAYAFVDVNPDAILHAFDENQDNAEDLKKAFNELGGKPLDDADGSSASFQVKTGKNHRVIVINMDKAPTGNPEDNVLYSASNIETKKGKTRTVVVEGAAAM